MKNRFASLHRQHFRRLSELGSTMNLSFSSHLVTGNTVIGIDGIRKTLLIIEYKEEMEWRIIHLEKVKSISVKKTYRGIMPGELNERKFEEFIDKIHLQFEYKDGSEDTVIPLFESGLDAVDDLKKLDLMVKNWQTMLSRMIGITPKQVIRELDLGKLLPLRNRFLHVTTVFK
jgi:N12 class adenine-specific DNA methylase